MTQSDRLAPYVTNLDRPVYALRNLPPEVVAVLFAYVSRSPASFRDNLRKLLSEGELQAVQLESSAFQEEKASDFHEKWVIGYGHASVAEHAVLHFAVEDLSILAAKALEDARLGSFTEKSSRYQVFDANRFHWPKEILGHKYEDRARKLVASLFRIYGELYHQLRAEMEDTESRPTGMGKKGWQQTLHAAACDQVRYLLPAGSLTSMGMTLNARSAAHLVRKLRAHELSELRELGDRLMEEGGRVTPVLLKHAEPQTWQREWPDRMRAEITDEARTADLPRVELVDFDPNSERLIAADIRNQLIDESLCDSRAWAAELDADGLGEFFLKLYQDMGAHEFPPRALEKAEITIECCVDYGAWRDLQRHRLLSPTQPWFGCRWGYELPDRLANHFRVTEIKDLLDESAALWQDLETGNPALASYFVPIAWRYRFLMRMNLRQAEHMIRLRSASAGHVSYRRVAQDLYLLLKKKFPALLQGFRVDLEDHVWAREKSLR